MRKLALIGAVSLFSAGFAFADETTTVQHRDPVPPGIGVVVGKPLGDSGGTTVTTTRDTGCGSTTVHKENAAGDSKTVKRTDC